jgi:GTPase KRas
MVEGNNAVECKIAIVGSTGVGKSSLCMQFTRDTFSDRYEPTIEDYYRKETTLDGEEIIFDIIDTAGQEGNLTNLTQIFNQSNGFVLVYDITRTHSFNELQGFYDRILNVKHMKNPAIVIVGNKCDIAEKREVSFQEGMAMGRKWNRKFWEVSAKTKDNLDTAFYECARLVRQSETGRYGNEKCCCLL